MSRTESKIIFPSNTGWVTSDMHAFKPREVTEVIKQQLCEGLIKNDDQIRQMLRSCKDSWYFAVTLGEKTLSLKIYDPQQVNDPSYRPMSSAVNRPRTTFFEIDRLLNIRQLTTEETDRLMRTAPLMYCDRCLKREEIRLCDQIQGTIMQPIKAVVEETEEEVSVDLCRPEFTLEPAEVA